MLKWFILAIMAIASYFIGNVNFAVIISKLKRKNIKEMGSGNPGTLNMARNFGIKIGVLTLFLDVLKGAVPTLVGYFVFQSQELQGFELAELSKYVCGFCVVIGHIYPVCFKFKGGKGIASTVGVFIVAESVCGWQWALVAILAIILAAVFMYVTEFGAMGSFIAITPPAISGAIRSFTRYYHNDIPIAYYIVVNMLILAICLVTWFAHRANIKRMLKGEEHPTSIKSMLKKLHKKKEQDIVDEPCNQPPLESQTNGQKAGENAQE